MITKVLQALANNVRFGAKEPGMRKLNDFMDVNIFGTYFESLVICYISDFSVFSTQA